MRLIRVFAAFYIAAVLALTMWPQLGHTHVSSYAQRAVAALDRIGIHTNVPGLEAISNVIMFVPFGILGLAILVDAPRFRSINTGLIGDAVKITLAGAALSAFIEAAQLLIPGRVTDFNDWWRNTLGALIGALIAAIYFAARHRAPGRATTRSYHRSGA